LDATACGNVTTDIDATVGLLLDSSFIDCWNAPDETDVEMIVAAYDAIDSGDMSACWEDGTTCSTNSFIYKTWYSTVHPAIDAKRAGL